MAKRTVALLILVGMLLAFWPIAASGLPAGGEVLQTLTPSADGYVVRTWGRYHVTGDNHNGEGLQVQNTADEFRRGYLQFDLSAQQGESISQATLRLYKTVGPNEDSSFFIHRIEEDWLENSLGLTDTTTPWLWDGLAFSQTVGTANNIWVEVDVTTEVNRVLHGDSIPAGILNLGLSTDYLDYTWGGSPLTFDDREGAHPPELVLTLDSSAPFAEAGPEQEDDAWNLGGTIQLDGSGSSDPEQNALTLLYSWRFFHLPGDSTLTYSDISPNDALGSTGADRPTFTPDVYGRYVLILRVRDSTGRWNSDLVVIDLTQPLPNHPRIWLTAGRLADLRQRASSGDTAWTRLQGLLDAHLGDGYADLYAPNQWMIQYALGYQVLRLSDPAQANTYADKAISLAQYVLDNDPDISADSWLYFGDNVAGLAIVYDWCYDRLNSTQRSNLIAKMNEWVAEAFAMPSPWAYYAVEHRPDNNRYYAHMYGRGMVGLATLGENEPLAQAYVDAIQEQGRYEVIPFRECYGAGGGWSEGWNYLEGAMLHAFLLGDAFRTVYGPDPFRENTFSEEMIPFLIHATLPDLAHGTPEGDMWETHAMIVDLHRAVMLILVDEYAGEAIAGYGQYWLEHTTTVPDAHTTPGEMYDEHNVFFDFLWGNPSLPASDFTPLPRQHLARGTGQGFARSDWSSTATWVSLTCGGVPTDHLHEGHGHFNLWRGEWLSADGNYGATTYGYNHEAWLHNVVTVNEQDVITGTSQAAYAVGRITRYESSGAYAYARTDLTPAMEYFDWNSGQYVQLADHYSRELLYLRPDTIVLLDRVRASNPAYFKRWQLNVPTAPTIDGTLVTAMGSGGQSKLFARSLLPQGATISSVRLSDVNDWAGLQGYQVRVRPATQQADDLFLHVLYATDAATPAMPATVRVEATGGSMVGTHIAATPSNFLVLFSADPLGAVPPTPVTYAYTPTATTLHLLADMTPNTAYTVTVGLAGGVQTVSVSPGTGFLSTDEGNLLFLVTTDGQVLPTYWWVYLPLLSKGG